ncbi:hypothetical protein MMC18_001508 [Xylographa bjoerkii]|nr:hypothetical protein [Xylographa bjoerkii]
MPFPQMHKYEETRNYDNCTRELATSTAFARSGFFEIIAAISVPADWHGKNISNREYKEYRFERAAPPEGHGGQLSGDAADSGANESITRLDKRNHGESEDASANDEPIQSSFHRHLLRSHRPDAVLEAELARSVRNEQAIEVNFQRTKNQKQRDNLERAERQRRREWIKENLGLRPGDTRREGVVRQRRSITGMRSDEAVRADEGLLEEHLKMRLSEGTERLERQERSYEVLERMELLRDHAERDNDSYYGKFGHCLDEVMAN